MNNITDYNEFRNKKTFQSTDIEENIVKEGAQLFDDNNWKVRTRVEIPTSLINAYVKKVQSETGEDPRKKWSEQEIAEEITKYVTTAFLTVENLPSSIVSSAQKQPTIQTQEEMPSETQVQAPAEPGVQEPAAQEPTVQEPGAQAPAQNIATEIPQSQGQGQGQSQAPAQAPAQI